MAALMQVNGLTTSQAPAIPGYDRPSVIRQLIPTTAIQFGHLRLG
jgi:hypothetical protein